MTIWKKKILEKEIYDALQPMLEGVLYSVEVQRQYADDCMATIDVNVRMFVNGVILDLPPNYEATELHSNLYANNPMSSKRRRK